MKVRAGRALIGLLEAGDDADVKAAGRSLDDWQRHGVLIALGELATSARQSYPLAAAPVEALTTLWVTPARAASRPAHGAAGTSVPPCPGDPRSASRTDAKRPQIMRPDVHD